MRSELVEHFPFLASLSAPARRTLTRLPVRSVGARTAVLRQGDQVEGVYLLTSGALRVYYVARDGRESTLYWVKPGQTCILALSATFKREPYPAWAETEAGPMSYVVVPESTFRQLLDEPGFRDFTVGVLAGRVFELMRTLEELGTLHMEQRVASFVLQQADPTGVVRITQERLAAHLGTAREVVFRALRSLVARKAVTTGRSTVRILDRGLLNDLVGGDPDSP